MMYFDLAILPVMPLFQDNRGISPVIVWIIVILLIILIFWLLWRERGKRSGSATGDSTLRDTLPRETSMKEVSKVEAAPPEVIQPEVVQPVEIPNPATRTAAFEAPVTQQVDDLEIIEGIGPKIAGVLNSVGVTSFAQLAAMDPDSIREILLAANLRLADPGSWPEQARLAANGDMAGLQALQDRLKGGR